MSLILGASRRISRFETWRYKNPISRRKSLVFSAESVFLSPVVPPPAASPRLPNRLNVFLGLHPQRGNTGVSRIRRALVHGGRGTHWAHVGQVRAVSQRRGVEEGGGQRRGDGRRRRWGECAGQALRASDEAREGLQGGGGGDGGREPGVQLQTGAQGAGGGAAEGEQGGGGGGVLHLDGAHLQLLLTTPLGPTVLEPDLMKEEGGGFRFCPLTKI